MLHDLNHQNAMFEPMVIFAVDDEREFALSPARTYCRALEGCYKGQTEVSYIAPQADLEIFRPHIEGQESILLLSSVDKGTKLRAAFLEFKDGRIEYLGDWHCVPKAEAMGRDAWTRDPRTGSYWVAG